MDLSNYSALENICFFINIYNTLVMHSLLVCGFPNSKLEWRYLLRSASYTIGGFPFSLEFIKDGILRGNKYRSWITKQSHIRFEESKDPRFTKFNYKGKKKKFIF